MVVVDISIARVVVYHLLTYLASKQGESLLYLILSTSGF